MIKTILIVLALLFGVVATFWAINLSKKPISPENNIESSNFISPQTNSIEVEGNDSQDIWNSSENKKFRALREISNNLIPNSYEEVSP